jgi:hypothetical protein
MKPAHTPSERNLPRRNFLRVAARTATLKGSVDLATGEQALQYGVKRALDVTDNSANIHQLTCDRLAAGGFAKDVYAGRTPLWL